MPTQRDIRRRIRSASNIQQITRAMKMVAAAKLRRHQDRMMRVRAYTEELSGFLDRFLGGAMGHEHPLLEPREGDRTALIVMTGDRGLCGAFNTNALRAARAEIENAAGPLDIYAIGKFGADFFRRTDTPVAARYAGLYDRPSFLVAQQLIQSIVDLYLDGRMDRVMISRPHFVNTMTRRFVVETLLPLRQEDIAAHPRPSEEEPAYGDYTVEPGVEAMATVLLARHLSTQMYRAVIEAACCEFAARMVAMDMATDNAEDMIKQLTLQYNRARQNSITKELLDIIGGAEGLK